MPCRRKWGGSAARRLGGSAARRLGGSAARRLGGSAARRLGGSAARRLGGSAARRLGGFIVPRNSPSDDTPEAARLPRSGPVAANADPSHCAIDRPPTEMPIMDPSQALAGRCPHPDRYRISRIQFIPYIRLRRQVHENLPIFEGRADPRCCPPVEVDRHTGDCRRTRGRSLDARALSHDRAIAHGPVLVF